VKKVFDTLSVEPLTAIEKVGIFRVIAVAMLTAFNVISVGFVMPFMISSDSSELVMLGFALALMTLAVNWFCIYMFIRGKKNNV